MKMASVNKQSSLKFVQNYFQTQPVLYRTLATLPSNIVQMGDRLIREDALARHELSLDDQQPSPKRQRQAQNTDSIGNQQDTSDESDIQVYSDTESDIFSHSSEHQEDTLDAPDETIRYNWEFHRQRFVRRNAPLTKSQCNAIELMCLIRQKNASLNSYEGLMEWHINALGTLKPGQSFRNHPSFISKDKLLNLLKERYKIYNNPGVKMTRMTLPHSKACADIVHYDAKEAIISLLTDPRICDDDYLFFGNNPFQGPPDRLNYIEDLNTGRAYTETHRKLITKPNKQVLLPVIFYIDGANTGQFSDLPITAVKFTFGIFKRKSRDKNHFWRTLGYVPDVSKFKSMGMRLMADSSHVESHRVGLHTLPNEGVILDDEIPKAHSSSLERGTRRGRVVDREAIGGCGRP